MLDNGRRIKVRADQALWEKVCENDRVKVRYRVGKYTGTVGRRDPVRVEVI
jgi:hypothetical protein